MTTNKSERTMDCEQVMREEFAEKYVLGRLGEPEQEAYEQHFFGCARCFQELEAFRTLKSELARQASSIRSESAPASAWWRWAGVAAAAATALVALILWVRRPLPRVETAKSPVSPAPETNKPHPPTVHPPQPSPGPNLAELARLEPPAFRPVVLRGPTDEATTKFNAAMKHYAAKDYRAALPGLREAAKLDPQAANISFYLAICELLTGNTDAAVRGLRSTIALGDTPYREEAHFYLAKAFLSRGDIAGAENELERTIALKGDLQVEARELLRQLQTLGEPRR